MYEVLVPKSVIKEIKKLGEFATVRVTQAIEEIAENPYRGVPLKGNLASIYKWVVQDRKAQYRIAYEIYHSPTEDSLLNRLKGIAQQ